MNNQAERLHVKALIKLKQQEMMIEKSLEYLFHNMKIDPDIVQNVILECKYLSDERDRIERSLYNKASDIDSDFERIRSIIDQLHNGENIDTDNCQRKMKDLLEIIEQCNVESELEILVKQEKELDDILNEHKVNLSKYDKKNLSANELKKSKSGLECKKLDHDIEDYDKINNFHSLVVKTGHTQHWKEKDHIHFLNARKKCLNIPALVMEIQKRCPDLSAEKIVNHEAWYKIYLNLREKQRKTINEWRKQKELEKKNNMEMIKGTESNKNEPETVGMGCEQKSYDKKFHKNTNKVSKRISSSESIGRVADERKELIKQWKIHKENAKIADEERLKHRNESMRAWKEKQFLMRTIEIRDAVAKYKQQKNEIKSNLLSTTAMENNKIVKSPTLIKSLRKKDEDFLNKRKNLIEMKRQKSMINYCNIVATDNCPRPINHSTLMKPTKIWNEKCKREILTEPNSRPILYIKDLPKLSLHNWRNQTSLSLI